MTQQSENHQPNIEQLEEIVCQAQAHDQQAFKQLYLMFVDAIYRYAFFKTNSKEDAEDITSETFEKLWRFLDKYQSKNFKAYLFTIARHTTLDFLIKKQKLSTQDFNENLLENHDEKHLQKLIDNEKQQKLYQAISLLPENYKEVIILRFIEELSIKETAELMQKSSVCIRVLQHRAMRQLKKLIKNV